MTVAKTVFAWIGFAACSVSFLVLVGSLYAAAEERWETKRRDLERQHRIDDEVERFAARLEQYEKWPH